MHGSGGEESRPACPQSAWRVHRTVAPWPQGRGGTAVLSALRRPCLGIRLYRDRGRLRQSTPAAFPPAEVAIAVCRFRICGILGSIAQARPRPLRILLLPLLGRPLFQRDIRVRRLSPGPGLERVVLVAQAWSALQQRLSVLGAGERVRRGVLRVAPRCSQIGGGGRRGRQDGGICNGPRPRQRWRWRRMGRHGGGGEGRARRRLHREGGRIVRGLPYLGRYLLQGQPALLLVVLPAGRGRRSAIRCGRAGQQHFNRARAG